MFVTLKIRDRDGGGQGSSFVWLARLIEIRFLSTKKIPTVRPSVLTPPPSDLQPHLIAIRLLGHYR